jgi:hypothetical protein
MAFTGSLAVMHTALRDRFESAGTAPRQAKALAGAAVWVVANMEIGALLCEMAAPYTAA